MYSEMKAILVVALAAIITFGFQTPQAFAEDLGSLLDQIDDESFDDEEDKKEETKPEPEDKAKKKRRYSGSRKKRARDKSVSETDKNPTPTKSKRSTDKKDAAPAEEDTSDEVDTESVDVDSWPYKVNKMQVKTLEAAGNLFTQADKLIAEKMSRRGFSTEQYVQAYMDLNSLGFYGSNYNPFAGAGQEVATNMSMVEEMAVYRVLGLPLTEFRVMKESNYSVTEHFNERVGGGNKVAAGWTLNALGAAMFAPSIWAYMSAIPAACTGADKESLCRGLYNTLAFAGMGIGGLFLVIGVPVAIVGHVKDAKKIDQIFAEESPISELYEHRIQSSLPSYNFEDPTMLAEGIMTPTYMPKKPEVTLKISGVGFHADF